MSYRIVFTKQAKKDIDALEASVKRQLYKKLMQMKSLSSISSVAKKLHNSDLGEYRLRIGNYRLIFDLDRSIIVVLRVKHRKDVYR